MWKVDESSSESCSIEGFSIGCVELSGSATTVCQFVTPHTRCSLVEDNNSIYGLGSFRFPTRGNGCKLSK